MKTVFNQPCTSCPSNSPVLEAVEIAGVVVCRVCLHHALAMFNRVEKKPEDAAQ